MNKKRYLNCKYLDAGMDGMLCERTPFMTCREFDGSLCPDYQAKKPSPPKAVTTPSPKSQTPSYTPPPMPEVKPPKQRTVLSVRDFAILMNLANMHIDTLERDARRCYYNATDEKRKKIIDEQMEELQHNTFYQDLLRIRDKLGELNIEIETPRVEVE
jgi:hypothetical protein